MTQLINSWREHNRKKQRSKEALEKVISDLEKYPPHTWRVCDPDAWDTRYSHPDISYALIDDMNGMHIERANILNSRDGMKLFNYFNREVRNHKKQLEEYDILKWQNENINK